jgi:hypothetical protein
MDYRFGFSRKMCGTRAQVWRSVTFNPRSGQRRVSKQITAHQPCQCRPMHTVAEAPKEIAARNFRIGYAFFLSHHRFKSVSLIPME